MLNNTRDTMKSIVADLKRFAFTCGIISNTLPIIYLIYAIAVGAGVPWLNVALLIPSLFYFGFYLAMHNNTEKLAKRAKRITKRAFKWYKLLIKLLNATVVLYSIYAASTHVTVWSVVLAAFTVISVIFQMILEVIVIYAEKQCDRVYQSFRSDINVVLKPVEQVKGLLAKFKREDETDEDITIELPEESAPKKSLLDRILRR